MDRQPAVADRFYPGDPEELTRELGRLIPKVEDDRRITAKAVILPHAGYVYSGRTAGLTLSRVRIPNTVVIIGPNHHGRGAELAVGTRDWEMPMGKVALERELSSQLIERSAVFFADDVAHAYEHSLEVQVPFLQSLNKGVNIVPLVVSHVSYEKCHLAATELAEAIREYSRPVLLVASTDMTHYTSRDKAAMQDSLAISNILNMDAKGLYDTVHKNHISMCGVIPTTITLLAAGILGAEKAELVEYTDSGAVSGDVDQVVGYAGLIVS